MLAALATAGAAAATTTQELAEALEKLRMPEAERVAELPGEVVESTLPFLNGATHLRVTLDGPDGPEVLHFVRQRSRLVVVRPGAEGFRRLSGDVEVSVRSAADALAYVQWLLDVTGGSSVRRVETLSDVPLLPTRDGDQDLRTKIGASLDRVEQEIRPAHADESGSTFTVVQDVVTGGDLVRYTVRVSKLGLVTIDATTLVADLPVSRPASEVVLVKPKPAPAAARPPVTGAAIEGTVTIPDALAPLPPGARYQIKTAGPVANPEPPAAIVYLEGDLPPAAAPTSERSAVEQIHYQFAPAVLPVVKGTVVAFPNRDDEYHNVFSFSRTKHFDLGRYLKSETQPEIRFDEPGLVEVYCDIHDNMRGAILVLDTPYFRKTEAGGHYRLDGLPAGRHVLKVWLKKDRVLERTVDLTDGATLRVDFP